VFILIFQRSVSCLSVPEPASDVGRSIYFLPSFETFADSVHQRNC
jgi:hypothetical protein